MISDRAHLSMHDDSGEPGPGVPSVEDSRAMRLLPFVLSITAGSVDIIGFLALSGLFTAHVTGNIVILAARLVAHDAAFPLAHLLSVPVFVAVLALTRLLVAGLAGARIPTLSPLLLLQFLLLAAFWAVGVAAGPRVDPSTAGMIFAGTLGVSAMAVQNALVRISLVGAPSTAVMTTNITVFTLDLVTILLRRNKSGVATARDHARHTWPAITGFLFGCGLGAGCESAFGLRSLVLPAGLALLALALGTSDKSSDAEVSDPSKQSKK